MSMLGKLWRELVRRPAETRADDSPGSRGGDPAAAEIEAYRLADALRRGQLLDELARRIQTEPGSPADWTRLGDWSLDLGRLAQAEGAFRSALHLQPMLARAHEGLGLALLKQGQLDEAYLRLETATKLAPDNAEAWIHWGLVDLESGALDGAAEKFQRAIDLAPGNAHGWHNLALAAMKRGETTRSIELFERALQLKPDLGLAHSNLALALVVADRLLEARDAAVQASRLKPDSARIWVVLADVHLAQGEVDAAAVALDRADSLDAAHVGAGICRAKLALLRGKLDEAASAFDRALQREPSNADARTGLAQLHLQRGEWGAGWALYEARRETANSPVRQVHLPEWQGEDCRGRGMLVHGEQGMGDIVLFSSCLEDLRELGPAVVLDVPQRLASLFERSFPWAEVVSSDARQQVLAQPASQTTASLHVPLGSLPRWFRRKPDEFRVGVAFLRADPVRTEAWRRRLARDQRPVVGLTWRGGLPITGKYQRSLDLVDLAAALTGSDASFVSLQHGDTEADLARAETQTGLKIDPGLSGYADLDDVAALTAACDGVITVCSTQAHLTGGLGKPGLVLVPRAANWRYGSEGSSSPWYASLTLARQDTADDWSAPLAAARQWVQGLRSKA